MFYSHGLESFILDSSHCASFDVVLEIKGVEVTCFLAIICFIGDKIDKELFVAEPS
jgi:hypothetical protein